MIDHPEDADVRSPYFAAVLAEPDAPEQLENELE